MSGVNGEKKSKESYRNKCQKYIACSDGHGLEFVGDKLSKSLKTYLSKDAVYNFDNNITEKDEYCSKVIKGNKDFKSSTKCWLCYNDNVDNDVKVRDHCLINKKYRGSAQSNCDINHK